MVRTCCGRGFDLLVISVGALAEPALLERLKTAAREGNSRMLLPAGAIGGIDAIAAMRLGGLTSVRYRSRKPPAAWRGSPAEKVADLDKLTGRTVLYRGTAGEAALLYPQNANVAAAVALAGLGFDKTEVELVADPDAPGNVHEIEAEGAAGPFCHPAARQAVAQQSQNLGAGGAQRRACADQSGCYNRHMTAPTTRRATNAFIGSPIERLEDLRFLTGRGQYVDDLTDDEMLHAVILRSSVAHGRIRSIDTAAARARPGVHAVITAADIGEVPTIPLRQEPLPAFKRYEQPVIAARQGALCRRADRGRGRRQRRAGRGRAWRRSSSISSRCRRWPIATLRARTMCCCSRRPAATSPAPSRPCVGDAEAAFENAPYTRREHFKVQRHGAVPMEPRGLLAEWDAAKQRVTVSGVCKVPFPNRRMLAQMMELPEASIRMVEYDVGGGFGVRGEFYPEDFLIPFAARVVGRPVKWIEDRRENLMAINHARDAECELEIACSRDGTILALRGHAFTDIGAYVRTNGATASRNIAQVMSGPYRIPNIRMDVSLLVTNKTPSGTYRGPGRFEADFFRERLFDMVADDLGIDRVEFRRRNLIAEAEMPYALATVHVLDIDSECDSGDYRMTLDRCLAEFDWAERSKLQGKLIDGRYHGIAVGCYLEGGGSGPRENVRLVLEADGTVSVFVGSSSVGQGVETVFAQIAADALEMPMDAHQERVPRLDRLCHRGLRLLLLALDRHGRLRHRRRGGQAARRDPRGRGASGSAARPNDIAFDNGIGGRAEPRRART